MADIQNLLQQLLNAVYGKDVRQAIHDAIHQCYADGKAGSIDLIARQQIEDNNSAFNKKIEELTADILEMQESGATAEVIEAKVASTIQEMIADGTMSGMTIADGSITQSKFADDVHFGVQDGEVTVEKLASDVVSKVEVGSEYELFAEAIEGETEWINTSDIVNVMAVRSATGYYTIKVYYTDEIPDNGGLPGTSVTIYSGNMTWTIGDRNKEVLKAKYIKLSIPTGFPSDIYIIRKSKSAKMELYSKGDTVGEAVEKTIAVKGTYNGDAHYIEVIPGETYTVEYESFNGGYGTGVYINENWALYESVTISNEGTITIPENANTLRIGFYGVYTVNITGKFYGDLTRPIQKLVPENFTEDTLKYIRENIGGNISGGAYYNCQDYGVIPGSSDNTVAMQALIDLIHENGGGVIWIPAGIYIFDSVASSWDMTSNITALCEMKSGVSLLGENLYKTVLKVTGNTPTGAGLFCQNSVYSGEVLYGCNAENLTVDMSEASLTTYSHRGKAFYYSGIKDSVFRDLRLLETPSTSMGIDMLDNIVLDSIYVYKGGRQWEAGGNGGAGIGIGTGKWENENYVIRNCVCDSCGHFGIFLEDQGIFSSAKDKNYPKGQIIANNVVRNGRNYGIGVRGGKNVLVTGNNLYENKGGLYTDYGAKNVVFTGNFVQGSTEAGFNFGNEDSSVNGVSYPCENIAVIGNTFIENAVGIKTTTEPTNSVKQNNIFIGNTIDES